MSNQHFQSTCLLKGIILASQFLFKKEYPILVATILDGNSKSVQFRFKENPQLDRSRTNVILVY